MIKKTKFDVIIVGVILSIMFIFKSPIMAINQGDSCASGDGTQHCENAILWECYSNRWEHAENCESGLCTPDNKRCAEEGEEAESVISGTFFQPKPIEKLDSGIIPKYPVANGLGKINLNEDLKVATIVTQLLPYIYVIAGLILLVMLVMGGLGLMTAAGNPDKMKAGYGKITNALIGFLIIFISYFVVQLVETVLSIRIF